MGVATMTVPTGITDGVDNNYRIAYRDITLSTTYATGGETGITPATLGMTTFAKVDFDSPKTNNFVSYNYTTSLVQCFVSSTGAEVGAGVNVSTVVVRARFLGH